MERLQKVLARAGIASRRAAEQIILAGRVRVDGRIVRELGTQVDERKSRVEVDGNKIVAENLVYIVLHKPRGVVCTLSDPEGRPTIRELIKDAGGRLVPVGRLDFHTSGALLCTNDGEFAQGLAHPKREVPKIYVAKVKGTVDDDALEHFRERIVIDGRPTQPAQVKRLRFEGDKTWLEITLREGRNRQVRRLGEATGFPVMRLARLSHAGVSSDDLRPGQWRELTVDELVALKRDYGVPKKVRSPSLDYTKGQAARGEGPAAKFDKQTLQKVARGPARKPPQQGDSRGPSRAQPSQGESYVARRTAPLQRESHGAPRKSASQSELRGASRNRPLQREPHGTARKQPLQNESRGASRKQPSRREPHGAGHKSPLQREPHGASRKSPFQRELAHSASQNHPNRPWHKQIASRDGEEALSTNRRGRAPAAAQVTKIARRNTRSAEVKKKYQP